MTEGFKRPSTRDEAVALLCAVGGVAFWNTMRVISNGVPDLSTSNFTGANLTGANLYQTTLRNASFDDAILCDVDLSGADLTEAEFYRTDLTNANLAGARFSGTRFPLSNLTGAKLSDADLAGSVFLKADLTKVGLSWSRLVGANLRETVLCQAQLEGANLMKATLEAAHLTDANLRRADLSGATLKDSDLRGADLYGADLRGADLRGVKVGQSGQKRTQLNGARLNRHTALWESANVLEADWTELLVDEQRIQRADVESGKVRLTIELPREGLTLYFNTKTTVFDRYLVQGVIVGVLGRTTTCEIEEFRQGDSFAVLRLGGAPPEDLDRVADALWHRVWEDIERHGGPALAHASGLDVAELGQALSAMSAKIDRIERRTLSEDALEYLDDTGAKHVREKTREQFRTWSQKTVRKLGGAVVNKLLGEVGDAATDLVKDGLGLKED